MKKRAYGTHDIAKICHVTPPTIGRWIEEGKLPSFKTAGGHRRVWDVDLVSFLKAHNIPIPAELQDLTLFRFLIVDDEADARRYMTRILRKSFPDAAVFEAGDGFEAGHKIASALPSLVILDLLLPGVDGFKICQTVRSDEKLKDMKILAITGHAVEDSKEKILKSGADGFLSKPFEPDELSKMVEKLLPLSHFQGAPQIRTRWE
jgi:excisionase family DNA binding protein